ncbi:hypothetical protein ACF07M_29925 [Streptomyces globisporus]|uniref:hypothetical protein n=1 Tax=Streptomyces globisporus TaxID=1908 RepID=UPI0036FE8993
MKRTELTSAQFNDLRQALLGREREIIGHVLQQPDYPPLPSCPECGAHAEVIGSAPPAFMTNEPTVLIDFEPCGHGFRAVDLGGTA